MPAPGSESPAPQTGSAPPRPPVAPNQPQSPPTTTPDVVGVGPFISMSTFGAGIAMPLLCSVAASTLTSVSVELVPVTSEIVKACQSASGDSVDTLNALNDRLAGLAALNPLVRPTIQELADALDANNGNLPFSGLQLLVNILQFFAG